MRTKKAYKPEPGNIYPIKSIDGDFPHDSTATIHLDTQPPIAVEATINGISRGFALRIMARIAVRHPYELNARINVLEEPPHQGTMTVDRLA